MRIARLTMNLCTALLMLTSTSAAEPQSKNESNRQEQSREQILPDEQSLDEKESQAEQMPEFLNQLDLTSQQEQEIQSVMTEYDKKLGKVWTQFHSLHWNAIGFEATLAAASALEGHDHSAHHESESKSKKRKSAPPSDRDDEESRQDEAVEEADEEDAETERPSRRAAAYRPEREQANGQQSELEIVGLQIAVLTPNGAVQQIRLPGNSKRSHSECEVCQNHSKQLDAVWKKMYELHSQLVDIEAERLIAIESKLNEDQLKQLEEMVSAEQEEQHDRSAKKSRRSASKDKDEQKE